MSKENIVIVGSGGSGTETARALATKIDSSRYNLIIVSPRDYYIHYPAALRMIVTEEGNLEDNAVVPLDNLFPAGKGSLKVGTVASIQKSPTSGTGGSVTLVSGESIPFRFLVLAAGNKWQGPLLFPEDKSQLRARILEWRKDFKDAKDIVLIGAGATGLELAGELRDLYPTKKITIVHAEELPLSGAYPEKFRRDVLRRWKARNIDFVLGDKIVETPSNFPATVKTSKGESIEADIVVPTWGGKPNTQFVSTLGPDVLDASGFVKAADTLQVKGHPDIFVAGDIISFPEQKQLAKIPGHVAVITANILSLLQGKPAKKTYSGTTEMIAITNGKAGGAGFFDVLWGIMLGDTIVASAKSKHLFVDKCRKALGVST